jgi:hypothetical protein
MRILVPGYTTAISLTLSVCIFLSGCGDNERKSPEKEAAINSALHWVTLIDSGGYDESWQIAHPSFKEDVTQQQWRIGLEQIRAPYGMVRSRKVKETKSLSAKPGVMPKKNLVVEFATQFEDHQTAAEFVTVIPDDEGIWRVSAYYLDR